MVDGAPRPKMTRPEYRGPCTSEIQDLGMFKLILLVVGISFITICVSLVSMINSNDYNEGDIYVIPRSPVVDISNPYIYGVKVTHVLKILEITDDYCLYEQKSLAFAGKINTDTLSARCSSFTFKHKVEDDELYKIELSY